MTTKRWFFMGVELLLVFKLFSNALEAADIELRFSRHNGALVASWYSVPDRLYLLHHRATLDEPWASLTNEPIQASSSFTRYPIPISASSGFYMVEEITGEPEFHLDGNLFSLLLKKNGLGWMPLKASNLTETRELPKKHGIQPLITSPFQLLNHGASVTGITLDPFLAVSSSKEYIIPAFDDFGTWYTEGRWIFRSNTQGRVEIIENIRSTDSQSGMAMDGIEKNELLLNEIGIHFLSSHMQTDFFMQDWVEDRHVTMTGNMTGHLDLLGDPILLVPGDLSNLQRMEGVAAAFEISVHGMIEVLNVATPVEFRFRGDGRLSHDLELSVEHAQNWTGNRSDNVTESFILNKPADLPAETKRLEMIMNLAFDGNLSEITATVGGERVDPSLLQDSLDQLQSVFMGDVINHRLEFMEGLGLVSFNGAYPLMPDLGLRISADENWPTSVISGSEASLGLIIEITNKGEAPVPGGGVVDIDLFAIRKGSQGVPIYLSTLVNQPVGGLNPDNSIFLQASVPLPPGQEGTYSIGANVDANQDLLEEVEGNNSNSTDRTIEMAKGFVDLAVSLGDRGLSLPVSAVAGDGAPITLPVEITNLGNVPAKDPQRVSLRIEATPANGVGEGVTLETLDVSVSALGVQAVKFQPVILQLPAGLPENSYRLSVFLEGSLAGNLAVNDVARTRQTIQVAEGYVDLALSISDLSQNVATGVAIRDRFLNPMPIKRGSFGPFFDEPLMILPSKVVAGDGASITLPLEIANVGNITAGRGQTVGLRIEASPANGFGEAVVLEMLDVSVSSLRAQAIKSQRVTLQLPAGLPENTYIMRAVLEGAGAGNRVANDVAQTTQFIEVAEGYVDLNLAIASRGFRISVPVEITNHGNVNAPRDATQPVWVRITPSDAFGDEISPVTIRQDVSVANLRPGATKKQTLQIQLPSEFEGTLYSIDISIGPWGD